MSLNNRDTIELSVGSLKRYVDELVVVDGGSTDGTAKAAAALGARIVVNPWPGDFSVQRQVYIDDILARHDRDDVWALILDSDETLCGSFDRGLLMQWQKEGVESAWLPRRWLVVHRGVVKYLAAYPHWPDWQHRLVHVTARVRHSGPIHVQVDGIGPGVRGGNVPTILHLDFMLRSYAERLAKVALYGAREVLSGYPYYYLFEDYGYRLKQLRPEEGCDSPEQLLRFGLVRLVGSNKWNAFRYWVSPLGFHRHVFYRLAGPLGSRIKRTVRRMQAGPRQDSR